MVSCYKQTTYQPSSRTETVNSAVHAVQRVQRVTKTLCCARHKSPHIRIRAGRRSVSRPARVPATCDKAPRRIFTRHPQDQLTKKFGLKAIAPKEENICPMRDLPVAKQSFGACRG